MDGSENVVVWNMLHDILDFALQNITQPVDGVGFDVPVLAEPVQLGTIDVVVGIQVVLGHPALLHGFPQSVIFDHASTSKNLLTYIHYPLKIGIRIVFV